MNKKELEKKDKETLIKMVMLLDKMDDLQSKYDPFGDEFADESDIEEYQKAYDGLKELM